MLAMKEKGQPTVLHTRNQRLACTVPGLSRKGNTGKTYRLSEYINGVGPGRARNHGLSSAPPENWVRCICEPTQLQEKSAQANRPHGRATLDRSSVCRVSGGSPWG